jgi:RHS repeat-associated protein
LPSSEFYRLLAQQAPSARLDQAAGPESRASCTGWQLKNAARYPRFALAVANASGAIITQQGYLPFDEGRTDPNVPRITETDFGYTGQRNVADLGLMDYKARFYDPTIGRFIQPDTIIPSYANPQSLNRFSYVFNSPISYNDPTGNEPNYELRKLKAGYGHFWKQYSSSWHRGGELPDLRPKLNGNAGRGEDEGAGAFGGVLDAGKPLYSISSRGINPDGIPLEWLQYLREHVNWIWRSAPTALNFIWNESGATGSRILTVDAPHGVVNYWHLNTDLRPFAWLNHQNIEPWLKVAAGGLSRVSTFSTSVAGWLAAMGTYGTPALPVPLKPIRDMWERPVA